MGSGTYNGTFADKIEIDENYFGPEVNSTNAISAEYCNRAIELEGSNGNNWNVVGSCKILSNKIDRSFRGIYTNKTDVYPIEIGGNDIKLSDDSNVEPWTSGNKQFGIYSASSLDQLFINQNIVRGEGVVNTEMTCIYNTEMTCIYSGNNQSLSGPNTSPIITCNQVLEAFVGFEFDGSQLSTNWLGNTMYQPMERGLALMNNGEIGTQGSFAQACADRWIDATAPFIWPNYCQTYVDGLSNASTSLLWCENPYIAQPFYNCSLGGIPFTYGISILQTDNGSDCLYPYTYAPTPSQRMASAGIAASASAATGGMNVDVYPNPSNGSFNVSGLKTNEETSITVTDIAGRIIFNKTVMTTGNYVLDLPADQNLYFMELKDSDGLVLHKKLIVSR
jgi:hypothetical protein